MKKEFNNKSINVRSFMISGLTAKWGIGEPRNEAYKHPLHAWTIAGRADGSTDFSPLPDLMGSSNALTLTGFDGTEGSGFENGYLVFDGVNDNAVSSRFTLAKDWTIIGEWEFMSGTLNSAGVNKVSSFAMYNTQAGRIGVYVNRNSTPLGVNGVGINAMCSDGRIYGKTWDKHLDTTPQTVTSSSSAMCIGRNTNGTLFTPVKFKNLAIYDRVLSEEQCKKAYDWLQEQTVPKYKHPTHAWTAKGRPDGVADVSPLYDLSGAGLDLTLKGFSGTTDSGFKGGKLLLDGIDDQLSAVAFSHSPNFTVVAEWEMLDDRAVNGGIRKPYAFYVYNKSATELSVAVNTPSYTTVESRCIKALTSVGKMYDENWNEFESPNPANPNPVSTNLVMGTTGSAFVKMSFSCLAFYDGVAFDKETCQKALEWLKAQSHG